MKLTYLYQKYEPFSLWILLSLYRLRPYSVIVNYFFGFPSSQHLRFDMSDCGHKGQYMFYNVLNNYMKYSWDRQCIHIFLVCTLNKGMYTPVFTSHFYIWHRSYWSQRCIFISHAQTLWSSRSHIHLPSCVTTHEDSYAPLH